MVVVVVGELKRRTCFVKFFSKKLCPCLSGVAAMIARL